MTNVPQPIFGPAGFIAPLESAILTGVIADFNLAFGGNLNPALETPQGQLATSEAAAIGNIYDLFCNLTQQVDPTFASGRMQDAIARIYFITRKPALPTTVLATVVGAAGVVIPLGSIAKSLDGNLYVSTQAVTIPIGGTITVPFAGEQTGPIPCPANTLTVIYRAIPGWDTINNLADGAIGVDVESRAAFEARRSASVAKNALGTIPSILGAVLEVTGVLDALVLENSTAAPITIGGVSLVPNSIYVVVYGGDATEIAKAIWSKKAPGCAYNGNTTITILDTNPGYSPPYPSYLVTFEIPDLLPITFDVEIVYSPQVPSDAVAQIRTAIFNAFIGEDGSVRAKIGSTLYVSKFYQAVSQLGSWAQLISIQLGSANSSSGTITGSITGSTLNVTFVTSGSIVQGQTLFGTGIAPGTKIVSFGSGAGGIGTYSLNIPQTVASESINVVSSSGNAVIVKINQVPTLDVNNITVNF